MAWDGSDRRERLPDDWPERRLARLKKDGFRCTWKLRSGARCPRKATDVDHRKAGDDHSMWNLQSLCPHHHGKKSSREGNAARRAKKASKARPAERHPGLR